jgi:hypothetical protein
MPWILFINKIDDNNEDKHYIPCTDLPPVQQGEVGTIRIDNSRRDQENGDKFFTIPCITIAHDMTPPPPPPTANPDMTIKGMIKTINNEKYICLPYNGGIPFVELSIKYQ